MSSSEAVDRVMANRLREHEQVLAARCGQEIVAQQGEDRRADRIGLHVVAYRDRRSAAVGLRPGPGDVEQHRPGKIRARRDRQ